MRRITIAWLLFAFHSAAQVWNGGSVVYPEKLREDIETLRSLVHQVHPDPYRYLTRAELERCFDATRDSIVVPISINEFHAKLVSIAQRIGDANLRLELDEATSRLIADKMALLPLSVRVLDGIYVAEEMKGFRSLPLGSRILSINKIPADRILERIGAFVVTDGANSTRRAREVEQEFPSFFLRAFGEAASFRVEYSAPDGSRSEVEINALTGAQMRMVRKPGIGVHPWHSEWDPASAVLWTTFSTLDAGALDASGQGANGFLTDMLKDLKQNHAKALVLDVRGAGGRDLGMAELVFATIAKAPFRILQGMSVRSLAPPDAYAICAPMQDFYSTVSEHYVRDENGGAVLRRDDERLMPASPHARAFDGPVYIVCDGATRDAAAALVMMARRNGRARVIGEETGTNACGFTGGRELVATLPNSGLRVRIPLVRYVPEGTPAGPVDHGEQPNHTATPQAWGIAKGRDTVRLALLELIKELQ
ncbi:MAG: hypothetical protein IPL52_16390 [Flavobacteriales bacterium]|nr:hypothetical protein [Flavobacteriales bacterium]